MYNIRTTIFKFFRTYATKGEIAGIRGKLQLEEMKGPDVELEEVEDDDMAAYESDFMNLGESYRGHTRDVHRAKTNLARQIAKRKEFTEKAPVFLTYAEQDQMRKLHENDPDKWTIHKLSESYPVLPEGVAKILNSNWKPTSYNRVLEYDTTVVQNWKNFKAGRMALDPALEQHLTKFKDRKICVTGRELLASHFVPPETELPKPRSKTFSHMLEDPTNNYGYERKGQWNSGNNRNRYNKKFTRYSVDENDVPKTSIQRKIKNYDPVKMVQSDFVKENLDHFYATSPEKGIALLDMYEKVLEAKLLKDAEANASTDTTEETDVKEKHVVTETSTDGEEKHVVRKNSTDGGKVMVEGVKSQSEVTLVMLNDNSGLETYVKEKNVTVDTQFQYTKRIQIPKHLYEDGKIYRVDDSFYDEHGEFLYRVPEVEK